MGSSGILLKVGSCVRSEGDVVKAQDGSGCSVISWLPSRAVGGVSLEGVLLC